MASRYSDMYLYCSSGAMGLRGGGSLYSREVQDQPEQHGESLSQKHENNNTNRKHKPPPTSWSLEIELLMVSSTTVQFALPQMVESFIMVHILHI